VGLQVYFIAVAVWLLYLTLIRGGMPRYAGGD
jgi:hypothetical protein